MSEIKLFNLNAGTATEITGSASGLEKPLQALFEQNLDTLLGVRFLASEHSNPEVWVRDQATLEKAKPLIVRSYESQ